MFWNKKTIKLYSDAAKYTGFHEALVAHLLPHLKATDTLLDIGCGHGFIDLLLARHIARVSCVDIDAAVMAELVERAPHNLTAIVSDFANLQVEAHDYCLLSFYGKLTKDYRRIAELSNKGIITIKNIRRTVRDLPAQKSLRRETHGDVVQFCKAQNLNFEEMILTLPFGQPFVDMDDVYTYLERYKPLNSGDYEDYLKENLQRIEHAHYRYYLPKEKQIGIAIINHQ